MKRIPDFQRSSELPKLVLRPLILGLLSVAILFGLALPAQSQQYNPPTNSLVGWWKGENNGNDSASTNNGIVASNVSYVQGLFGKAFNFPGQYPGLVNIRDCDAFILTNSLTVAAWVNMQQSSSWVVFSRGEDYAGGVWSPYMLAFDGARHPQFLFNNGGSPGVTLLATNLVPLNKWTHIAGTWDGVTGDMRVYVNGNLVAETTNTVRPLGQLNGSPDAGIAIGAEVNQQFSFNGYVDEALLYSRALSASEILLLATTNNIPCTPHPATATATVVSGFVVGATITDSGCGYSNAPTILILGGGGTGAAATATISNGVVTGITINNAGIGYTSTPTVYISFPLSITSPPQSLAVNAYDTASFTVTASGAVPLIYQWSFKGTNLLGATSSTLTISNVTQSDLGTYTVEVSDVFGSETNSSAMLSMYPIIVTPFSGAVTYWGTNAIFGVEAWGTGPLTYQWYNNGIAITGATNSTLTFTSIDFTNAGLYTVVVGNFLGSVTNTPEQVVVNPGGVSIGLYPGITISGVVGVHYTIQRTPDLSNTNLWTTVANLVLTQPVELWVDTNINTSLPSHPQNFYRVFPGP